jgi:hypothetical protein
MCLAYPATYLSAYLPAGDASLPGRGAAARGAFGRREGAAELAKLSAKELRQVQMRDNYCYYYF